MGKKIEGYWDCPQCGKTKIKGRFRYCDSCGRPRGNNVKFYMIETDNYAENQDEISEEPDWYCSYCNSLNSSKSLNCESCGASQEDSDKNYFQMLEEDEQKKKEESSDFTEKEQIDNDEQEETNESNTNRKDETNEFNTKRKFDFNKLIKPILYALPVLLMIGLLINFFIPKQTTLYVNDKSWERTIEVEEYKTVLENDWKVPSGGRLQYTKNEIHHYNSVIDHYETVTEQKSERYISGYETVVTGHKDLGNGYFKEITSKKPIYSTRYYTETKQKPVYVQVPIYQTKYYYEIERWVHKNNEKSFGTIDEPYWPEVNLEPEIERTGKKDEVYKIKTVNKKEKEKIYELSFTDWKKINKDDTITVKISAGEITEIINIEK